jgi:acyl-coenzyme A thioesterase PaaI-like protein
MKLTPRFLRFILNVYPPYLGTGVYIDYISPDWRRIDVSMKLHWYNRNAMKTHFGGSLYAMVDPHLMLMFMQILGKDYIVWDKAAGIDFVRPGRGRVSASLVITDSLLEEIHQEVAKKTKYMPCIPVNIIDESGEQVAVVEKTLYIRKKRFDHIPHHTSSS